MKRLPPVTQPASDSGMGHIREVVEVSGRGGGRFERLEALADTGATYTCIPRTVLERLGIVPEEEWPFVLADGREVRYPMAWIDIRMQGRVQPTIVVFAEPGSEPILGVVTLEEFRLAVDPVTHFPSIKCRCWLIGSGTSEEGRAGFQVTTLICQGTNSFWP